MANRRESVTVTADVNPFIRGMAQAGAATSTFADRLDAADGRMANLVQSTLALAPALVPLGAAAVPAIAGLATQLGFAALAAGTAVLAFQGVGTALKALDAFNAAPTTANFEKLQQAMDKLGPAGQEFVLALEKMRPELQRVQAIAQQGLFPGVTAGMQDLLRLMPQVQDIIFTTSSTLGDLAAAGGKKLSDGSFTEFFNYLNTTARPILTEMGKTLGNFIEGFAHLVVDFGPTAEGFSAGLLKMSRSFNAWAQGVSQTKGFQDFIDYIDKSGPQALAAIGAIANALLQIVEAAAPIGSKALPVITALANVVAAIADTPAGTVLVGLAAAVGVFGRSLALLKTVGLVGGRGESVVSRALGVDTVKSVIPAYRNAASAARDLAEAQAAQAAAAVKARDAQFALSPVSEKRGAVSDYVAAQQRTAAAAKSVEEAEGRKSAAILESAASAGKAAALIGGLALSSSGLADKTGFANTASLALLGTIAGPWGAAIGGGIGLAQDFAAANNSVEDAMKAADAAAKSSVVNFANQSTAVATSVKNQQAYSAAVSRANEKTWNPFDIGSPSDALKAVQDMFTHEKTQSKARVDSQLADLQRLRTGTASIYAQLNNGSRDLFGATDQQLTAFADHITPALQKAGISVRTFLASAKGSDTNLAGLKAIRDYFASFDSATGKSKAVGAALQGLSSQITDTATAADSLKSAMDSLFGVQVSQSAAADAYTQQLRTMRAAIEATNGAIDGNSKAALTNRGAIRDSVTSLEAKVNADAAAGVSGDKLVGSLLRGRDAIEKQAVAAGASRKQVAAYLDTLGLTPKNLITVIRADGALSATQKLQAYAKVLHLTPRQVATLITEAGAKPTQAKIEELARLYHLTPKEVRTLLSATDNATRKAAAAQAAAAKFAKLYSAALDAKDSASPKAQAARAKALAFAKKYAAYLDANDHSSSVVRTAEAVLAGFNGRHATSTITTVHQNKFITSGKSANPGAQATGGMWDGPVQTFASGGYTDRGQYVPRVSQMRNGGGNILWSEPETGWEAYISGKPGMRERNLQILSQAGSRLGADVIRRYADGGLTRFADGGSTGNVVITSMRALISAQRELNQEDNERKRRRGESKKAYADHIKAVKAVSTELSKTADKLKAARDARKEYAGTVAGAYVQDPFSGSLGGFNAQVGFETKNLRSTRADLTTLQKNGLSGQLYKDLAASGNSTLIDQFAHLTKTQIGAEEKAYNQRNALDHAIGSQAANAVYNKSIQSLTSQVEHLTAEMHKLRTGHSLKGTTVNFNGNVKAKDAEALANKTAAKIKTAASLVNH